MPRPKIPERPPEPPEVRHWLKIADEVVGRKGGQRAVDRPMRSSLEEYEHRVREVALSQLKRSR